MQLEQHPPPWLSGAAASLAGLLMRLGLAASCHIEFSLDYVYGFIIVTHLILLLLLAEYSDA
jgi:hypothetical protein